ncbi:dihydroneopterin aldolase [Parashewanella tropica]|uniref:dihydroneopterin aldolase n=1 Tax=Parashewanella tropica TaxID=2547970 RepID=UPI00105A8331|nr:dihydroneopterin aldolase [Parashewanella tropica]
MDKVLIKQLKVDTVIGVYDWEKQINQSLYLDLEMQWNIAQAAQNDDYKHALCYETVSNRLIELITEKPIELIETVAQLVADCLMSEFNVPWVKVTVNKPGAVKACQNVAVEITRQQQD